ncbi:MAG: metallophosphoesterase [Geminicoccaceae bacterium]
MIKRHVRGVGLAVVGATVLACAPIERGIGQDTGAASQTNVQTPESLQPLTVAFIGDQGSGSQARAVLRLIRAEGADLVLLQGDLDYRNDPAAWDMLMTEILGADFPVFAAAGNHDKPWYGPNGYQAKLQARLNRIADANCSGDLGVQSACTFRGLFFILSGAGTIPDEPDDPDHVAYLREQLAQTDAVWRICSWHKNQKLMQVGRKSDEVGWKPYEACREGGAIVATAHEHSYSRTYLMDNFGTQSIASTSDTLAVEEGRSFAFVSGLGGRSIRRQHRDDPWWASVYTRDQDANPGALFCAFFVDGEPNRASCYFKDIDGRVPDRFELISVVKVS